MMFPELNHLRIDETALRTYRERAQIILPALPREIQCNQIVLYGSVASGLARSDSDIDILVLLDGIPDANINIPFDRDEDRVITNELERAGIPLGKSGGKYDVVFRGLQYLQTLHPVYTEHLKTFGVRLWPLGRE